MDNNLNNLLLETAKTLADFLEQLLPTLFDNWWQTTVFNQLSFHQQRRVKQKGIDSLSALDLAALLRVLDKNWYEISTKLDLPSEIRHFVKEMQTIRNKWAHMGADGISQDDMYRDLDTLQRFAAVIKATESFVAEIHDAKTSLLKKQFSTLAQPATDDKPVSTDEMVQSAEFELGQIVTLRSDPSTKGAIIAITPSQPEDRYTVFIDGGTQIFYASQIGVWVTNVPYGAICLTPANLK